MLPQISWTAYFVQEQGYPVDHSLLHQDNQSAMLLEMNGKKSSTKRTRHMHICYFYIKDKIDSNKVQIQYCPTDIMLADYFTKPIQGTKFYTMRDRIMNIDNNSKYHSRHRSVLGNDGLGNNETNEEQEIVEKMTDAKMTCDASQNDTSNDIQVWGK